MTFYAPTVFRQSDVADVHLVVDEADGAGALPSVELERVKTAKKVDCALKVSKTN